MFVYLCVYACVFVYLFVYACVFVYLCVYACVFVYMCVYACVFVYFFYNRQRQRERRRRQSDLIAPLNTNFSFPHPGSLGQSVFVLHTSFSCVGM